jgi:hypothetical protein
MYSTATAANDLGPAASTKVPPPQDNLTPMEGTMSQYKSEVQKRYKAYDNVKPPGYIFEPFIICNKTCLGEKST